MSVNKFTTKIEILQHYYTCLQKSIDSYDLEEIERLINSDIEYDRLMGWDTRRELVEKKQDLKNILLKIQKYCDL